MIWDDDYAETLEKVHMLVCARYGFPGYMKDKEAFIADTEQHVKDGLVVKADTLDANFPGFYNSSHTADRFSASRISFMHDFPEMRGSLL
ncbi:MAG: hypothetical protein ACFWTT_09715 [Lactobacillus delbrueckii]|jgi:hypothetical protein